MPENDEDESDSRGGRRQRAGRHESEALERWHDFVFAPTLGPATLGGNLAVFPLRTHRVETPSYLRAEEAGGLLRVGFPSLMLANAAELPVLVVAGEPVRDRGLMLVTSQSLVVPPRGTAEVARTGAEIHHGAAGDGAAGSTIVPSRPAACCMRRWRCAYAGERREEVSKI